MNTKTLTTPELILLAGTRAALGAGVALLLSGKLTEKQRQAAGWALFAIGAATTLPLANAVFRR